MAAVWLILINVWKFITTGKLVEINSFLNNRYANPMHKIFFSFCFFRFIFMKLLSISFFSNFFVFFFKSFLKAPKDLDSRIFRFLSFSIPFITEICLLIYCQIVWTIYFIELNKQVYVTLRTMSLFQAVILIWYSQ